jgi:hypothetical protein
MWILTVAVVPVNTFITKGTASIWYFPSKELIMIVILSTFGALSNTKVIQSAPKKMRGRTRDAGPALQVM